MPLIVPELPLLITPTSYPDLTGPEVVVCSFSTNALKVTVTRFWRQLLASDLECGDSREFTIEVKKGISRSVAEEVASSLKVSFLQLKSEIGSHNSSSVTWTDEQTETHKSSVAAEKCGGVRYILWQLVDRIELRSKKFRLFFGTSEKVRSLLCPLGVFKPDRLFYPTTKCCPDGERARDQILLMIRAPEFRAIAQGSVHGAVALIPGIEGPIRIGEEIPTTRLARYNQLIEQDYDGQHLTAVIDIYEGNLDQEITSHRRSRSTAPRFLLVGLAIGVGLTYLLRRRGNEILTKDVGEVQSPRRRRSYRAEGVEGATQVEERHASASQEEAKR